MSSIDDRVVNMQFNNAQFQKGISETNSSLNDLKSNLKLDGATSGIGEVQKAANRFSLANMEGALQNISSKFSIFGVVAFTAIQSLTNSAINAGKAMGRALIDPIVNGGEARALALQQAKFQFRGLGLDIDATMAVALAAVKDTAFGLQDAALAAGQFGASGITAGHGLIEALRGISGVAAQTGSSYSDVARIFQSVAGNGRLMGQDLLSLASRGVNAAATLAKSMGTTEVVVREMVSKGQISFTMFSEAMNNTFGPNAFKANELYTGALANMRAALARLGAEVQGPKLFALRDVFNALSPIIDRVHKALMPMINAFNDWQVDTAMKTVRNLKNTLGPGLVIAITNVVTAIGIIGHALEQGFHQIFPDDTVAQLRAVTEFIKKLTFAFVPGTKAAGELRRTFAGLFAIFSIAGQILGSLINSFFELFGFATKGAGGILTFTATIGDFLVKVDAAIKKGEFFQKFFNGLAAIVAVPVTIIKFFFGVLLDGFNALSKINSGGLDDFFNNVGDRFSGLTHIAMYFQGFWLGVIRVAEAMWRVLKPIFSAVGSFFGDVANSIKDTLRGMSFDDGIKLLQTGILAGFMVTLNGFFGNIRAVLRGDGLGFITQFKITFNLLRTNLKALEMNTNAKTLTQIAIAVALLAASAVALSLVDAPKLAAALGAMSAMVSGLLVAFKAFSKIEGVKGLFTTLALSLALQSMAVSILILAGAVAILGAIPLTNLIQGVLALVVVMGLLAVVLKRLDKSGPGVLLAAAAIAVLAPGIAVLAGAVAILGAIPFLNLLQGLGAFVVMLGALVGALVLLDKLTNPLGLIITAGAIGIIAISLAVLVGAVAALGALPFLNLLQGVGAFVIMLAALTGALLLLNTVGPMVIFGALAIGAVALSMIPLIGAVALLGALPLPNIIQGIVGLAAVLAILTVAVLVLGGTGPVALLGAAAIVAIAIGLAILAPALTLLAGISWEGIGRLLTILSAGLGILVVMGILLIPASVGFLLLGAAIFLIGAGVSMAATGIAALALGIGALVLVGGAGIAVLAAAILTFIGLLPLLGFSMGKAIVNMIVAIADQADKLTDAFVKLLISMLDAIGQVVPQIIDTATKIIVALVNALVILVPLLINAGITIMLAFLTGIADNMGEVTTQAINILVNFVNAIANNMGKIIDAAVNLLLQFLFGIGDAVRKYTSKFIDAATLIFRGIVNGLALAIERGGTELRNAGLRIGQALIKGAKNALGIASPSKEFYKLGVFTVKGITTALTDKSSDVAESGRMIGETAINSVKDSISGIGDVLDANMDMTPSIRPVLDLSAIKKDSKLIPGMLPSSGLSVNTSNDVATSVSLQEQAKNAQLTIDASVDPNTGKQITFIQNNTSPKALSTSEVYRQTKNQLSTLKGELDVVDQSGSS